MSAFTDFQKRKVTPWSSWYKNMSWRPLSLLSRKSVSDVNIGNIRVRTSTNENAEGICICKNHLFTRGTVANRSPASVPFAPSGFESRGPASSSSCLGHTFQPDFRPWFCVEIAVFSKLWWGGGQENVQSFKVLDVCLHSSAILWMVTFPTKCGQQRSCCPPNVGPTEAL